MLLVIRIVHAGFALLFIACIIFIYYCAITRLASPWLYPATIILLIEGIAVGLNKGDCPLGPIHLRYGDDKGFLDYSCPQESYPMSFLGWQ